MSETNTKEFEFVEEGTRKPVLSDTFSPDRVQQFIAGNMTLGQLYGISMEEAYSVAEMGYTFLEHGKLKQAQSIFQALVLSNPYDGYFHAMLGSVYLRLGLKTGALEEYSLAIGLDPSNVSALVNRGEILMQEGAFEEAAADFKRAVNLDPQGINASANRARILSKALVSALKMTA